MFRKFLKTIGLFNTAKKINLALKAMTVKGRSHEDIFTHDMYLRRKKRGENVSGPGSSLEETAALRKSLPGLFQTYGVKRLIDVPCGNFFWFQHVNHDLKSYKGYDIVKEVIEEDNRRFADEVHSFEVMNCLDGDLGAADMILVRDLLIHFSNDDIFRFFKNLQQSDITYILTTSYRETEKNEKVETGMPRPVNLCLAPFNFPEPLDFVLEESRNFDARYYNSRGMALWRLDDLYPILERNEFYNTLTSQQAA